MAMLSVAEAAERLGVSKQRVLRRIADGSLPADSVGYQWVINEAALVPVAEVSRVGRPLSERSACALIALSVPGGEPPAALAASEKSRARKRLHHLLARAVSASPSSEQEFRDVSFLLRSMLRNRAGRRLFRASPSDLPDLRQDRRLVLSGLSHPDSGIASGGLVEGYVRDLDLGVVEDDYLLSPGVGDRDANVVLHVFSFAGLRDLAHDGAPLLLAADLVEHRGPREEARAVELLRAVASRHGPPDGSSRPRARAERNSS